MQIANVISKKPVNVSNNFNVVESDDDIIAGLPTLIVGFNEVIGDYPDLDMLDRKLDDMVHWTFTKKERRTLHSTDLLKFIEFSYRHLVSDITYVYVDPIHLKLKTVKKIINKIKSLSEIYSYQHNDMIYIYGDNLIFGIDLRMLKFIGIDPIKVKNKIQSISKVFLDDNGILIEYKEFMERLDEQVKYIPYLYSLSNE